MSKYHAVSSGMVTRQALPSITRQRGTTTGNANLMLYGAGKTTVSNNTTFIDSSANNFTVTRVGDMVQSGFNPFSQASAGAGYFDGTGDSLTVPAGSAFAYGTGDFTVEGWFYSTAALPSYGAILFSQSVFGTNYFVVRLGDDNPVPANKIAFTATLSGGGTAILSSTTWTQNTWNHFAVCRVSGTVTVYLNGVGGTPTSNTTNLTNTTYVPTIGQYTHNTTQPFTGYLSSLRVVKGTAVYTSNFTPPTSPLTAITNTSLLLLMDNYSIVNSTSTNLPVTINTGASISTAQFPTGMSSSMLFNGTSGYVSIPNGGIFQFGTGDFTIEWWQYQTGAIPYPRVFSIGTYPTAFGVSIESGFIYYWTNTSTAVTRSAPGLSSTWAHIAVARSSGVTRIFLNGTQLGANIPDTANISNSSTALVVAAETIPSVNTYFSGYISNFRSVKGAALYTSNFTVPSAPLPLSVTVPNYVTNNIYGVNQIP